MRTVNKSYPKGSGLHHLWLVLHLLKKTGKILLLSALVLVLITYLYIQQDKFGKNPSGVRLERIKRAPNYRDGKFQNSVVTPELTEGYSMSGVFYKQFIEGTPRRRPTDIIPSVKTNLLALPADSNILVWFGHSSYYLQIDGKRILVDPVFSGNASPVPGTVKSFKGTDVYSVADLPEIDYLFISHDHYDHADYETLIALRAKTKKVICGLGVGAHFEHWGYDPDVIMERNWHEKAELDKGFTAFVEPARHFSGRGFLRNKTLWASYVLQTPTMKIYIGGDSGYGPHYAAIGKKYGPLDVAILDNGQYDDAWRYIHNHPAEVLKATRDLRAKRLFPVHSSKFMLANHAWDEPLVSITKLNRAYNFPLITPVIGEPVNLSDPKQKFKQWWVGLR